MAGILCQWINHDVKLSKKIDAHNLALLFSNGYLFAELLWRFGVVESLDDFEDGQVSIVADKNFDLLKSIFEKCNVKFDDEMQVQVKNAISSVTVDLLYQLFVVLESQKRQVQCCAIAPMETLQDRPVLLKDIQETMTQSMETCQRLQELISCRDIALNYHYQQRENRFRKLMEDRAQRAAARDHCFAAKPGKHQGWQDITLQTGDDAESKKQAEIEETYKELNLFEKKQHQDTIHFTPSPVDICILQRMVLRKLQDQKKDDSTRPLQVDLSETAECKLAKEAYVDRIRQQLESEVQLRLQRKQCRTNFISNSINLFHGTERDEIEDLMIDILLRRSRFEQKVVGELMAIRKEKATLLLNRQLRAKQMLKRREEEFNASLDEEQRNCELERLMRAEQIRKDWEFHKLLLAKEIERKHLSHLKMCKEVLDQLIDLSICISLNKKLINGTIPKSMWRDWKTLFVKGIPFIEHTTTAALEDPMEVNVDEIQKEEQRQLAIDEAEFYDYKHHLNRWYIPYECDVDVFTLRRSILGHIVHALFEVVYPFPPPPEPQQLPFSPLKGCVIGKPFAGKTALAEELLKNNVFVKILSMQDVLETALVACRQFEDHFSTSGTRSTSLTADLGSTGGSPSKDSTTVSTTSYKQMSSTHTMISRESVRRMQATAKDLNLKDEQMFDMSRMDDDDDEEEGEEGDDYSSKAELTSLAILGRVIWSCMKKGQEIDDTILVKAFLEVLKTLPPGTSWILDGFPCTRNQAELLDKAFVGHELPENLHTMEEEEESFNKQLLRTSQLVDDPDPVKPTVPPKCLFDVILHLNAADENIIEWASEYISTVEVEKDFNQLTVHHKLQGFNDQWPMMEEYYNKCSVVVTLGTISTDASRHMETLVPLLLKMSERNRKQWEKKFASNLTTDSVSLALENEKGVQFPSVVEIVTSSRVPSSSELALEDGTIEEEEETTSIHSIQRLELPLANVDDGLFVSPIFPARPGDKHWEFVEEDLSEEIAVSLSQLWQKMEVRHLKLFHTSFRKLRQYRDSIIHTFTAVQEDFFGYLKRPDGKQEFVDRWLSIYNSVPEDMRDDEETKAEMHMRLNELLHILWNISDNRLLEAKQDLFDIANSGWLEEWLGLMVNRYILLMQAELDRFYDTVQILKDYYNGLEDIPLKEYDDAIGPTIPFVDFQKTATPAATASSSVQAISSKPSAVNLKRMPLVRCSYSCKVPLTIFDSKDQIVEVDEVEIEGSFELCSQKAYEAAINAINKLLADVGLESFTEENEPLTQIADKRGKKSVAKNAKRKDSMLLTPDILNALPPHLLPPVKILRNPTEKIRLEKAVAFYEEECRVKLNLWLIYNKLSTLLATCNEHSQKVYKVMESWMNTQYNNELVSIENLATILGYAIEEERSIIEKLELNCDTLSVKRENLLFEPEKPIEREHPVEDAGNETFTLKQLGELTKQLKNIAPSGYMTIYELDELLGNLVSSADTSLLPLDWTKFSQSQVQQLVQYVSSTSGYVNWHHFVLSLAKPWPQPTVLDLLNMLDKFRDLDVDLGGTITKDIYRMVSFWFKNEILKPIFSTPTYTIMGSYNRLANLSELMFDIFARDGYVDYMSMLLHFAANSNHETGFLRALSIACSYPVVDVYSQSVKKMEPKRRLLRCADIRDHLCGQCSSYEDANQNVRAGIQCRSSCFLERAEPTIITKKNPAAKELLERFEMYREMNGIDEALNEFLIEFLDNDIMQVEDCLVPFSSVFYVFLTGLHSFEESDRFCLMEGERLKDKLKNIFHQLGSYDCSPVNLSNLMTNQFLTRMVKSTDFFRAIDVYDYVKHMIPNESGMSA